LNRSALAPDLPTIAESGVPGFEITSWYGLAAPAGTPNAVIARLNAEIGKAMQSPDVVAQFRLQGYEPLLSTPDEMSARIKTEIAIWTRVIHDAGIQPQ
jgi:tripartite-type tricarboxylate transporter receptor subunit TctC